MKLVGKFVLFVINVALLVSGIVIALEIFDKYADNLRTKYVVEKDYE